MKLGVRERQRQTAVECKSPCVLEQYRSKNRVFGERGMMGCLSIRKFNSKKERRLQTTDPAMRLQSVELPYTVIHIL